MEGQLRLTIAGEVFALGPGDSWSIPGQADHGVEVVREAVVIEVFSPRREDMLPEVGQGAAGTV